MCRLAAYLGERIALNNLMLNPEHSIYMQAWQPKELTYAKLNADGFGFGWYSENGDALSYRNHLPIWNDINLHNLAAALHSNLWLAMVRSATTNTFPSPLNVQPFKRKHYLFIHNGFIKDFNATILQALARELPSEITKDIHGLTDSEYLFGLFCHLLADDTDRSIKRALTDTVRWCEKHLQKNAAMLNIMVANGTSIFAVKYAVNETAPSLYFVDSDYMGFPKNSKIIASEKFSEDDCWQTVPNACLLTATPNKPILVEAL